MQDQLNKKHIRLPILIGVSIILIFFSFSIKFLIIDPYKTIKAMASTYDMVQTEAEVSNSEVVPVKEYFKTWDHLRNAVTYHYFVNNKQYRSDRYSLTDAWPLGMTARQKLANQYKINQKIPIYYKKSDPQISVIQKPNIWDTLTLFLPLVLIVLIIMYLSKNGIYSTNNVKTPK